MASRVLVTRPEPGASATARKLEAAGFDPVLLPLSRTGPIGVTDFPRPTEFDTVAITSANAIRYARVEFIARFAGLPCFTVGERTGRAARDAGFADVRFANGDAAELAERIAASMPQGSRLLYLCGQLRRPVLEGALAAGGYSVTPVETYRTEPLEYAGDELRQRLGGDAIAAVLLFSPFAAERFSAICAASGMKERLGGARILCLSEQVRLTLDAELQAHAETAAAPDEKSLLALLGRAN